MLKFATITTAAVLGLVARGVRANIDAADYAYFKNISDNSFSIASSTNTYNQAIYYGQTHPTRDGGSWNGWCASLMWRAGNLPESSARPSAIDAYHDSKVISKDINSAPSGAFHWWDIGTYGHVAMAMPGGNSMMASCYVTTSWGDCIGTIGVSAYTSKTGAKYLGWSYDYAGAEIADVHSNNPSPSSDVPRSSTEDTGVPDTNYYKRQQLYVSVIIIHRTHLL
jgi:hypothetical protein